MPQTIPTSAVAYSILGLVIVASLGIVWFKIHDRKARAQVLAFIIGGIAMFATLVVLPDVPLPVYGTSQNAAAVQKAVISTLAGVLVWVLVYWLFKPRGDKAGGRGLHLLKWRRKAQPLRTMSSKELEAKKAQLMGDLRAARPLDDQPTTSSRVTPAASPTPTAKPVAMRALSEADQMELFAAQLAAADLLDPEAKRAANHQRYRDNEGYRNFCNEQIAAGNGDPRDDV